MTTTHLIPKDIQNLYEVHEWRNATGVLQTANMSEWEDIIATLRTFRLYKAEILKAGGSKGNIAKRIDGDLFLRGWRETQFRTMIKVDDHERASPTHKVDCFKGRVALEVEWNSKDSVYDRDLNNFRLLFDLRVIDAGVIITRSTDVEKLFIELGRKKSSFGKSTTHINKLLPKLEGGGGGGCPVLVFGIGRPLYSEEDPPPLPVSPDKAEDDDDDAI